MIPKRVVIFIIILFFVPTFLFAGNLKNGNRPATIDTNLVDFVNPFIGTEGAGNTFPGPSTPFGMVQIGPDTDDSLWATASGYEYSDKSIIGFSMTHLSGTGIPDLGDFLFMPTIGQPKLAEGTKKDPDTGHRQRYSHTDEQAAPGYYQVKLLDSGINVELTSTDRAGLMRFTFPKSDSAYVLTDLKHVLRWNVIWSHIRVLNDSTITGFHLVHGWAKERYLYFAARYSKPFKHFRIMKDGKPVIYNTYRFRSTREAVGKDLKFLAQFRTHANEQIMIKVGISAVSSADAMKNLDTEIPDWNFARVRKENSDKWEKQLDKIRIDGTRDQKETFYTSLYHSFLTPNLYEDVNGKYRGLDWDVHKARDFTNYTVFSLWDTFRAEHPLLTLVQSKRDADMVKSMLAHYDQSVEHLLPVWSLQGNETWCMIGYHAVPVIVDAYMKGVKGFDPERAYEAIKTTAMNPNYDNVATYAKLGYVPDDKENESVSKTLEYAYDDWCVAQMAKALGKKQDYEYFMKRAGNYKNLFDPSYGLMRGKDSNGNWHKPFHPHQYVEGGDFTEGTSWQYSWFVPQDVPGLIKLMGGKKRFTQKLDSLFTMSPGTVQNGDTLDITGMIGEYAHGNEPSHHIAFLYSYAGQPWKTQMRVRQIMNIMYGDKPNSLKGNDDCGQMSAWYIFNTMGFYPVCPGSDYYVIGSPLVKKVEMHLSNGHTFTMIARNQSPKNKYIQSVELNGKTWDSPFLPYDQLKNGGEIIFTMGSRPNKNWGLDETIPTRTDP
ncbi:MAG TPA: GH92 family glycosyl hydrolase [Balneolales bacterium]|nr:GH92 family glycosyl hydrolase [Balneolales bacterium]